MEDANEPTENDELLWFLDGRMEDPPKPQNQNKDYVPILKFVEDSIELRKVVALEHELKKFHVIKYDAEDLNRDVAK